METYLLQDLAIVMAAAGGMTLICHKLRQPVVLGYLLAGLLIGPYTPPFAFIHNLESIHTMAELGLVFLMFSLGLEFNIPKMRRVGFSVGLAALLEVTGMLLIGYFLGLLFGWNKINSLFLGAVLSMSSTTIIVKVLMDFKMMKEKFTQIVFGILILEDIVAIVILSILSGLGKHGGPDAAAILHSFFQIGLFIVLFLVLGLLFIPRMIHWVAHFGVKEVLGIVTLGLCLGGSLLASYFELSVALGAFLTGAVLAASKEINDIEEWIHPVRDMFSAIFFVSAGLLIQPQLLWEYKVPILAVTLVTLIGKVVSGAAGSFLAGYDLKTSARVGMSLAQIGEFSFVIASLGVSLKVTSDFLYPLVIAVSSLTTLATPYLIRNSDRWVDSALRSMPGSVHSSLDRYQCWLEKNKQMRGSGGTAIFSKYLIRLGIYFALLSPILFLTQSLSSLVLRNTDIPGVLRMPAVAVLWAFSVFLALPLFMRISKYSNHLVLLLITRNKTILRYLNVNVFYNTMDIASIFMLATGYLGFAYLFVKSFPVVLGIGVSLFLSAYFFRRRLTITEEWLEKKLDHITGLATSEPTRLAVIQKGEKSFLLMNITDQVTLPNDFHAQSIRSLGLREKTGGSIVAIYRNGKHIANPAPDLELLPDDVLVTIGNEEELSQARKLLLQSRQ